MTIYAPMKNVEWVEELPFHQLGAFKWQQLGLDYALAETPPTSPELVARVRGQFREAGCNAREAVLAVIPSTLRSPEWPL